MPPATPVVELTNYRLPPTNTGRTLAPFDLRIAPGRRWVLATDAFDEAHLLMGALATLVTPEAGRFSFCGRPVDFSDYRRLLPIKRRIAYMGHETNLLSNRTIRENLLLARCYFEDRLHLDLDPQAEALCARFQLSGKLGLRPAHLNSVDRKAAVAIRELTKNPDLLVIDGAEELIGHSAFGYMADIIRQMVANGAALVLFSEMPNAFSGIAGNMIRIRNGRIDTFDTVDPDRRGALPHSAATPKPNDATP